MITRILEITRLYLFTTYRSRAMLIFGFLLPFLFTFVVGQTIAGAGGPSDEGPREDFIDPTPPRP